MATMDCLDMIGQTMNTCTLSDNTCISLSLCLRTILEGKRTRKGQCALEMLSQQLFETSAGPMPTLLSCLWDYYSKMMLGTAKRAISQSEAVYCPDILHYCITSLN